MSDYGGDTQKNTDKPVFAYTHMFKMFVQRKYL